MPLDKEKVRIKYYEDNMTKGQHILAYVVYVLLIGTVFFIYYHSPIVSLIGGVVLAYFEVGLYAKSVAKKRQLKLRVQFKDFLEIIAISVSGGAGRSLENAVRDSLRELKTQFSSNADIVREIGLIVDDYDNAGIPMHQGFMELGDRSDLDDIKSFATIYATIEGKTSDFGYVISQTKDIIKDKIEITMEIETSISSAKGESYAMLVLPLVIVVVMSLMGGSLLDSLFTTALGRIAASVGLICTIVSYVIATKVTQIEV